MSLVREAAAVLAQKEVAVAAVQVVVALVRLGAKEPMVQQIWVAAVAVVTQVILPMVEVQVVVV